MVLQIRRALSNTSATHHLRQTQRFGEFHDPNNDIPPHNGRRLAVPDDVAPGLRDTSWSFQSAWFMISTRDIHLSILRSSAS
jgi:hypothetical protein